MLNRSILKWIKSQRIISIPVIIGLIASFVLIFEQLFEIYRNLELTHSYLLNYKIFLAIGTGVFILLFIFGVSKYIRISKINTSVNLHDLFGVESKDQAKELLYKSESIVYKIAKLWEFILLVWALTYAINFISLNLNISEHFVILRPIYNFLNNLSTIALYVAYLLIAFQSHKSIFASRSFIFSITLIIIYSCFDVISTFFLIDSSDKTLQHLLHFFPGLFSGLVIALFVGRLDSRILNPPIAIISILYLYAIIQILYPIMDSLQYSSNKDYFYSNNIYLYNTILLLLSYFSLICKIAFYLLIIWCIATRRLLTYLLFISSSQENVIRFRTLVKE